MRKDGFKLKVVTANDTKNFKRALSDYFAELNISNEVKTMSGFNFVIGNEVLIPVNKYETIIIGVVEIKDNKYIISSFPTRIDELALSVYSLTRDMRIKESWFDDCEENEFKEVLNLVANSVELLYKFNTGIAPKIG